MQTKTRTVTIIADTPVIALWIAKQCIADLPDTEYVSGAASRLDSVTDADRPVAAAQVGATRVYAVEVTVRRLPRSAAEYAATRLA